MDQNTINKVAKGVKIFGAVLFVVCVALAIWSLTRPPVMTGPMPPDPNTLQLR